MKKFTFLLSLFLCLNLYGHPNGATKEYSKELAHYPSPLPDRVVLTWNDDPATTQAVNWRTDVSVKAGLAQLAVANANGRALKPDEFKAETSYFKSDINEAHYHSVTFKNLQPNTLYAYRVGDGDKFWSEWIHFKTAKKDYSKTEFVFDTFVALF